MAKQVINIGASPNDGTGDFVRDAFDKTNDNFTELYDGKQDDLVSGTNIKTINGDSVLGSGDLVISGGGGGASGYHMQLLPGGPYYGGIWQANTNAAGTNYANQTFADYIMYFPFIPNQDFTSNEMRFQCSIAGSGDEARLCIYSHDGINAPQNKLFESSAVDMSTTGYKTINVTQNWTKGEVYWLGIHTKSGLARIQGMGTNVSDSLIIGLLNSARFKMWGQVGQTFSNGAPATASPNTFRYDVYMVEFK